jgi:hypothetical protein
VTPSFRVAGVSLLLLAILLAFALRGSSGGSSPEHRTDSDAIDGASALPQLAEALGHPTVTLGDTFQPDLGMGVVFVLNPTTGFTRDEARRLADYVTGGGTVVYAADQGDPELDLALHVGRRQGLASGTATGTGPMLGGVNRVTGAPTAQPLTPAAAQVVLLRSTTGPAIAVEELVGRGRVVTLTDPLPLCNGYLDQADNGRLAADLVSLAPGTTRVAFDEFHHTAMGPSSPLTSWLSTPLGVGLLWAVVALFAGLWLRGRAFGPRLEPPGAPRQRTTADYVAAVGGLLQRSRAAAMTASLLDAATRRSLAARHGLRGEGFERSLAARSPAAAEELAAVEAELAAAGDDEQRLLAAARRLHALQYPEQPRR